VETELIKPLSELLDYVRGIDGFPIAKDEDILKLSDPPNYTACPNPYMEEFINIHGKTYQSDDSYSKSPFIGAISEGKNDPIYMAHAYPTKVPPNAIMKFIEHYTNPGDIILDCFSGTGMAGVASSRSSRFSILLDLSPLASFISYNYNTKVDNNKFKIIANKIINEVKNECSHLYKTKHTKNALNTKTGRPPTLINDDIVFGEIVYIVWSDLLNCPFCKNEFILWDAIDKDNGTADSKKFLCPNCNVEISINDCKKIVREEFDSAINAKRVRIEQVPVLINYKIGKERFEKIPDEYDKKLIKKILDTEIPYWFPSEPMMNKGKEWGDTWRSGVHQGITHTHHFYSKRNLWIISAIYDRIIKIDDKRIRNFLLIWFTSSFSRLNKMNRYMPSHNRHVGPLSGTLYISYFQAEISPFYFMFENKYNAHKNIKIQNSKSIISCQSATNLSQIKNDSIDYIFVDPPFGDNLMYSELNFIIESWLKIYENTVNEAIINSCQNKELDEYTSLMTKCFKELYRVLKPNRWITIEFHNSRASVWNGIQESITRAGFIIAQVSILDKVKGTTKQLSYVGAVEKDLIINAYKPREDFSERFLKNAGERMEVDFITQQLEHLPIRPNIERTEKMLFSKMLAHYVENGFKIRYNSTNFYRLLSENFIEIDGYWFLDTQINEYNNWKSDLSIDQINEFFSGQQVLFVSDEKSALTWLFNFLNKPKTYSEIFTAYQQVATTTNDDIPEIKVILDNNFILEDGKYRRPLTRQEIEEKNKNRERELDRAFNKILERAKNQRSKIKTIRKEALIHGFTKCYQQGRYDDILSISDNLHNSLLESSGDLMDFVDIARIKTSGKMKIEDY